jgi:hypothetical protein
MTPARLVASRLVRFLTLVFAVACVLLIVRMRSVPDSGLRSGLRFAAWALVLGTVLCAVHATRSGYAAWMKLAAAMQQVVTTILFGLVYVGVVPLFSIVARILDPLFLRKGRRESYWIPRRKIELDREYFRRMA